MYLSSSFLLRLVPLHNSAITSPSIHSIKPTICATSVLSLATLWALQHFRRLLLHCKMCLCVGTQMAKIPGFSTRYPTTYGSRPRGRHLDYTLTLGDVGLSSVTCERCPQFGTYPHNNASNTSTRQYHREFSLARQVLIMHIPSYPTKDSFIGKHNQAHRFTNVLECVRRPRRCIASIAPASIFQPRPSQVNLRSFMTSTGESVPNGTHPHHD